MLTRKQYDLLMFIHKRVRRDGVSPSFDEMKEALDLRSKSGIHRLVTALEERGFIRRLAHRARAVEIIRLPENVEDTRPNRGPNRGGFRPSVIEGDLGRGADPFGRTSVQLGMERIGQAPDAAPDATPNATDVPLIGRIAAGAPIEALEHGPSHLGVPSTMLSASGEHYALEVKGDSMIEAGIFDGDFVVVRSQPTADLGDTVVAGIPGEEATVKIFARAKNKIVLRPANTALEDMVFDPDEVTIYGRVVTVLRRL